METTIISLGGSIIVPDEVDTDFLSAFRSLILEYISKGNRAAIVTGGGSVCRKYIAAAKKITATGDYDLDLIGIASTKLNAELVRAIFGSLAYEKVINNPNLPIKTNKKIIIGSGWKPGCSSDLDAVLLAKNLRAKTLVNLTNVKYIYDKDPRANPDARPFRALSWQEMQKLVGTKWVPGKNVPFDPKATKLASKLKLTVVVMSGMNNLSGFLANGNYEGTIIR